MEKEHTSIGRHVSISDVRFKSRSIELYALFGDRVRDYSELPETFREFVEAIGYIRVCSVLIARDLQRGRSERSIVIKYGVSRTAIQSIKERKRQRERG
jgi:hypothetical protein